MAQVVLMRAYYERPNFYSAAVYISQSTGSLMFLVNLMLIVAASFGYGLQRLFYGPLRPIESEQLYDKAWFAVSETLLAMTIFRDDIGIWFFAMFLCLLAGKVWQWIGEGRVEFLEQQPPANPQLFHARLASSLIFSAAFDIYMIRYCIGSILSDARPGVMVMFGFEYVLLAIASVSTLLRYTLSLVELYVTHRQEQARNEARRVSRVLAQASEAEAPIANDDEEGDVPGWEEKGRWVFYLDLATDFIKSVVYLGFFMILMTFYGIPIHIMRDLFMTIRSLLKRIKDFVQYRNATRDMNTRYSDASVEELERENTCIVCREEMKPWVQSGADGTRTGPRMDERQRPKKLPCGHILHFSCLRSWLERQQVCPTCRRPVLSQTAAQAAQTNNAPNRGAPILPNHQGQGALQRLLGGHPQGAARQQGEQNQPQPQGQANAPAGNLRVFNIGPFRVALGNLRLPPGQQNNPNHVRNAIDQLHQQAIVDQAARDGIPHHPAPAHTQVSTQNPPHPLSMGPVPGAVALHPSDIQSDILRLQHNIIESMRQLHLHHDQLEVIHSLLGELNRIQQASGVNVAMGRELPFIAPLHSPDMSTFTPQAYTASGEVLRPGDTGVPVGLSLPEGWTLRPMALAPRPVSTGSSSVPPTRYSQVGREGDSEATPSTFQSGVQHPVVGPTTSGPAVDASSPRVDSDSLGVDWSFGNVAEHNESVASSSGVAIAESASNGQNVTRRTVTVEEVEDNGQ